MKRNTTVTQQIRTALAGHNRLAFVLGLVFGSFVPTATWTMLHNEHLTPAHYILVAGGLIYSAMTVFQWAKIAFGNPIKSLGFVVLIEGVMTYSATFWLSCIALGLLVVVNSVAAACHFSAEPAARRQTKRRRQGAQKRQPATVYEFPVPMGVR